MIFPIKHKLKILHATYCLFFAALFLSACDIEDCASLSTNTLKIRFYRAGTENEYSLKILNANAEGTDSLFFDNDSVDGGDLVINPFDTTTLFTFELIRNELDTLYDDPPENTVIDRVFARSIDTVSRHLQISYSKLQRIISPECGVEQQFVDLNITDHDFDSVVFHKVNGVEQNKLDRFAEFNVKIYF